MRLINWTPGTVAQNSVRHHPPAKTAWRPSIHPDREHSLHIVALQAVQTLHISKEGVQGDGTEKARWGAVTALFRTAPSELHPPRATGGASIPKKQPRILTRAVTPTHRDAQNITPVRNLAHSFAWFCSLFPHCGGVSGTRPEGMGKAKNTQDAVDQNADQIP